jgi:exosortase/archaeosortase
MTLDAKLRCKEPIKKKRDELNIKFRKMYWLLGSNSELSVHNKLILYKQVILPVWNYGIQLWGCANDSNIEVTQRYQNKVLKSLHHATFEIVAFIVISESRRLQISSLSSPSLMKRDFKTTSTSKRPEF